MPEYESMFGEYRTKYLPQMMFNSYFMMRRIAYSATLVFGEKYPIMQAFVFCIICVPILAYQIVMHPYLSNTINAMMIINESFLIVQGAFLFIFAEPSNNSNRQEILGWAAIGSLALVIAINIIVIWIIKIILIIKEFSEWWAAYRRGKVQKSSYYKRSNSVARTTLNVNSRSFQSEGSETKQSNKKLEVKKIIDSRMSKWKKQGKIDYELPSFRFRGNI